ncbi:DUF2069 domain-containing protein [Natronospira bacteriovora]|uniref:DUF2069 domain-containing protein n=1 Tax=Natronospira bacteriovora TaxID=3069753 RepID=A0ABU0W7K7_9GAMM|nr:DUF2069 domain-containing protein [Natronospira sp. AB-CW4]MDQ2069445.1 DUF2069 domain-containing protein [Natronospira sp. AB-CW4]
MNALKRARAICAGCALLLALNWGLWYGVVAPSDDLGIGLAIVGMAPLILLIPGMLQGKVLPTAVLGFLSLFYLAHGFTELVANPAVRVLASASTLLALLLFLSASHSLRIQSLHRPE